MLHWIPATWDALNAINKIGGEVHLTLPERPEVFEEKFRLFPEGCFVLQDNGSVAGYGFSHPWLLGEIPKLDTFLGQLPPDADCIFIHDVMALPSVRGQRAAQAYVSVVAHLAVERAINHLALVSVYDTASLWRRYGFNEWNSPQLSQTLVSYGSNARYMVRQLKV